MIIPEPLIILSSLSYFYYFDLNLHMVEQGTAVPQSGNVYCDCDMMKLRDIALSKYKRMENIVDYIEVRNCRITRGCPDNTTANRIVPERSSYEINIKNTIYKKGEIICLMCF